MSIHDLGGFDQWNARQDAANKIKQVYEFSKIIIFLATENLFQGGERTPWLVRALGNRTSPS
jgi:hypothetical protein